MTTNTLSTQTPAEIDAQLFPLWAQRYTFATRALDYRRTLAASLFPKAEIHDYSKRGNTRVRGLSPAQWNDWHRYMLEAEAKLSKVEEEIAVFDEEFDARGGWTRYVLVRMGHLHYRHCHSLRPTTAILLVSDASGLNPEQVVGHFGETACTKCFPDAPVAK